MASRPLTAEIHQQIHDMTRDGKPISVIARAVGANPVTVKRYAEKPVPTPKQPMVELGIEDGTFYMELVHDLGARRQTFRPVDVRDAYPDRHFVLIRRYIGRMLDAGIIERLAPGLYVGRGYAMSEGPGRAGRGGSGG